MKIQNIAFVILHYMDKDTTIGCINSLNNIKFGREYSIIIVDNASPNNSGKELYLLYKNVKNIHVIISGLNVGFAKGNNLGYSYAKRKCNADCIIIVNNDVVFNDSWEFNNIQKIYLRTGADIIGPDIISKDGIHQSPLRQCPISDIPKVRRMIMNRKIYILYFKIKKKFFFLRKMMFLEKFLERENQKYVKGKLWNIEKESAVLHGACLIFTPLFVKREDEAFNSKTFMYGEEDLLSQKAKRKGYKMLYTPKLYILHLEERATKSKYTGIEKAIFQYTHALRGYELLLEELKNK